MQTVFSPYLRLMRIDKPVGFFLLLWPTLWALWIASKGVISFKLLGIFIMGVFIMRSAGCVVNDIADRDFDGYVTRTANRPLAAKEIPLKHAIALLMGLLVIALSLVLFLNLLCLKLACIGLLITLLYPYTKRWIAAPQCILGVAFSLGIPMAFSAVSETLITLHDLVRLPFSFWLLWGIGVLWPIIYDTLYAMVDRKDDIKIGINSTAIFLGKYDRLTICSLEIIWFAAWIFLAQQLNLTYIFYVSVGLAMSLCLYECVAIRYREPSACFRAFLNHAWVGGILFIGLVVGC